MHPVCKTTTINSVMINFLMTESAPILSPCMHLKKISGIYPLGEVLKRAELRQEEMVPYLLELLYLGLFKHGEDIGAGLLCSPLSLVGGLLACLGRST